MPMVPSPLLHGVEHRSPGPRVGGEQRDHGDEDGGRENTGDCHSEPALSSREPEGITTMARRRARAGGVRRRRLLRAHRA